MSSPYGFQEYGDNDPSVLLTSDLTSLSTSRGLATTKGSGAGSINFNSDGVLLGTNAAIVLPTLTAAEIAKLDNGGCMTVWVDPSWFGVVGGAGNEYLFMGATSSAQTNYISAFKGYQSLGIGQRNADGSFSNSALLTALGKTAPVRCDWSWQNNFLYFYVNGFLQTINSWKSKANGQFTYNTLGGFGTGSLLSRLSRYQLSTRPIMLPIHPATRDIVTFGHSFTVGMDYSSHSTDLNAAIGGTGTLSIGPQGGGIYNSADAAGLAVIQSGLARHGIGIGGGRIFNYGVGGSSVSAIVSSQIPAAKAANHRHPTLAIVITGINGVNGSINTSSFTADFVAAINAIIALGTTKIIVCNMCSTSMNTTSYFATPTQEAAIDSGNSIIASLETLYPGVVHVVDIFTLLGGHNDFLLGTDFVVDNIHPQTPGYNKIGNAIAQKVYEIL